MKIILTFFAFILTISSVFAEVSLNIKTDEKEYDIEDSILLRINISSDEDNTNLTIKGLDDFQIIGKRQSQSITNINGIETSNFNLNFKLLAKKSGEYVLGPVSTKSGTGTGSKIVTSNTVKINVTGERIMVNNLIQDDEEEDDSDNEKVDLNKVDLNNSVSKKEEKFVKKKILGIDGKEMTDIYPQKDFLKGSLFSKYSIYILAFILTLIIILILIYNYFLKYLSKISKKINKKVVKEKPKIIKKTNFKRVLENLEQEYLTKEKEIFYGKFGDIFRKFLDEKLKEGLSKKSFTEFTELSTEGFNPLFIPEIENIKDLYKKIYYPEYNKSGDNLEVRKGLIQEFKKIIKN